jgi:small subunit ribosomal protein S20
MANIASQIKRNRQNETRRRRNRAYRRTLKTHLKQFRTAVESGDRARAEDRYQHAARQLDKAAAKGVIHRNYAANRKSRMAKTLQSL